MIFTSKNCKEYHGTTLSVVKNMVTLISAWYYMITIYYDIYMVHQGTVKIP